MREVAAFPRTHQRLNKMTTPLSMTLAPTLQDTPLDARYESIAADAVDAAKKSLLDLIGVTLAASGVEPVARRSSTWSGRTVGDPNAPCWVSRIASPPPGQRLQMAPWPTAWILTTLLLGRPRIEFDHSRGACHRGAPGRHQRPRADHTIAIGQDIFCAYALPC